MAHIHDWYAQLISKKIKMTWVRLDSLYDCGIVFGVMENYRSTIEKYGNKWYPYFDGLITTDNDKLISSVDVYKSQQSWSNVHLRQLELLDAYGV